MGNLTLKQVPANTAGNYVDSNTADDELDLAATEKRSVSLVNDVDWSTGSNPHDSSTNIYKALRSAYIEITGAQAAARTFTLPNNKKFYWIKNSCTGGFNTTVKNVSGTGITIANGQTKYIYCNVADIEVLI